MWSKKHGQAAVLEDGGKAFAPVGGDGQAVVGVEKGQGFVEIWLHPDQGQERRVIDARLILLGGRQVGGFLKQVDKGIGRGEGFYVIPLFRGQGGAAEMLQDVVVKGLVGQARVNHMLSRDRK